MMRTGLRKSLNWGLVAAYVLASVLFLLWALNNAFHYPVVSDRFRLSVLDRAPCAVLERYVGYVLENRGGLFRSPEEKYSVLDLLLQAQEREIGLCYDPQLILPYLGQAAPHRRSMGEDREFGIVAENLLIERDDPALIRAAFDRYRATEPGVGASLCGRLDSHSGAPRRYAAIMRAYCPAPSPKPDLTPDERRRKDAFERILEDSRRGAL